MVGVVVVMSLIKTEGGGMRGILWSDLVTRVALGIAAAAVAMFATGTSLSAGAATVVPEIDGSSLSAALGLMGAGVLWLRARRRSK
jgi:MYXO-CTERM domain-containing protein